MLEPQDEGHPTDKKKEATGEKGGTGKTLWMSKECRKTF